MSWTVFTLLNAGIVGSNPTQGMDVCLRLFCVYVVLCVHSGLSIGWSPSKESYRLCIGLRNWKSGPGPTKGVQRHRWVDGWMDGWMDGWNCLGYWQYHKQDLDNREITVGLCLECQVLGEREIVKRCDRTMYRVLCFSRRSMLYLGLLDF
jgi:hypothetical protein